ncbi:LysR family transcriptional regulator [Vibrio comitans]|uniref:LysR family transcriptional regulator n=2 Tax=Vibrio comitans TaxID=413401 RepID=A0A4Y3IIJ1_9VIBR|nr:LysR family transcriptional regulator [Vibrio comitans]GEA59339.1 LysR family transcriptional regulator [Vibrio comitans NBRC 102076]
MNIPSLYDLSIFIAVAEAKSFSEAASIKEVSQPVVSRTIRKLESTVNASLFKRTTRKVSLTAEGEWLLLRARAIQSEHTAILEQFQRQSGEVSGELIVDAATPFALHAIIPLLMELGDRYPELKVTLVSSEERAELLDTKIDIAIRIGELEDSTMRARKVGVTNRGLYASPTYIEKYGIPKTVKELRDHQLLGFYPFTRLNKWPLEGALDGNIISEVASNLSNSGESLKQMAINHLGVACLSRFTVAADIKNKRLVPVLEKKWKDENIPIYAVFYTSKKQSLKTKAFIDFLIERIEL